MKSLAILQNADFEGPGTLPGWAEALGFSVKVFRAYEGELPTLDTFSHLVVLGTPQSVHDIASLPWLGRVGKLVEQAIKANKSVMGICFGAQLMAHLLGGRVEVGEHAEIGWQEFPSEPWPAAFPKMETAALFQWHREFFTVPDGAEAFGISAAGYVSGFCVGEKLLAVSGHLEIDAALVDAFIGRCWSESCIVSPFAQNPATMLKGQASDGIKYKAFAQGIFTHWLRPER